MFKINKRFQELHRPLTPEEFKELEASIKAEGINDPLIIWQDTIVDGHHRNKIAKKLGISYQAYQKLENPRKCNPTVKTLEKISEVLGKNLVISLRS